MNLEFETISRQNGNLTRHAHNRACQRSIPQAAIDLLIDFGAPSSAGGGAQKYAFSKRTWRAAAAYLGPISRYYDRYRAVYVIVADGKVVTAAWTY